MKEIIIPSKLRMQLPDQLAYELELIKTPEKIESNKIKFYVLIGVFGTIFVGLIAYLIYENHQKNLKSRQSVQQLV